MNHPRILYMTAALTLSVFSCTDHLTSLNENPKRATEAPAETLFANAEKNLADVMTTPSVNTNIFRLLAQYWTETTYTDESRYDLITRNIPQSFWNSLYRDVLLDIKEAKLTIYAADPAFTDPVVNQNQWAIAEILEVYTYQVLINTYGNIPYSQALDYNNVFPEYEDARTIHNDLLARLDQAIAKLDPDAGSYGSQDIIYRGDVGRWEKFAYALKLKLGMMLADVDFAKASAAVEQAAPHVFTSNADNAEIKYLDAPPNTNPIWVNLVQSGRKDFVAANTIIDVMTDLNDPRNPYYFTTVDTIAYDKYEDGVPTEDAKPLDTLTVYYGGTYGTSNNYSTYSKPADAIIEPTFPGLLMDYSEVAFFLAEAAARGMNVEGSAEEHYNRAITASINYWGGSEAEAEDYLAQPDVSYNTAPGDFRQKIGTQKWIALYNRGFEGWTEWRRLDYPPLNPAVNPLGPFPLRYTYPVSEQNLNTKNYNRAASDMGGDVVTSKLFWDVR